MIWFSPLSLTLLALISSILYEPSSSSIINPSKANQVSSQPKAFVYEGFRMDEESNHLIFRAKSELKRSAVANKPTMNLERASLARFELAPGCLPLRGRFVLLLLFCNFQFRLLQYTQVCNVMCL
ncbi:hypothetical protein RHGRI_007083 [Rhododendron griersonianum]|uniref:Uncharacterized protein n=1 Tax=Rhododendron griersonianum TaxID=479676 RepID=A0AAV6KYF9_9ERIC|nr:hypothetical protein RHGRI_007083 [Rhododendron griersonianum]